MTEYSSVDFARKRVMWCALSCVSPPSCIRMDGPGTLTWEEFLEDAESFVLVSDELSDGWELLGDKKTPGEAYLARRRKRFISKDHDLRNSSTEDLHENDDWSENFDVNLEKDPFEAPSVVETPLVTEHHILWSISYSVPIIYFNGWRSDFPGVNQVSVEEAQKVVPDSGLSYTELSQAIHPILGTPFLHLHPCLSYELLRNASGSKNKLVSWLSIVAPVALSLDVRPEYHKLTF